MSAFSPFLPQTPLQPGSTGGERTEGLKKRIPSSNQFKGGAPQGNPLAGFQADWKRAGIFPRVIYFAGYARCSGMRSELETLEVTDAEKLNGIEWKGKVRYKISATSHFTVVGEIGEKPEEVEWTEWVDTIAGSDSLQVVYLTLKSSKWDVTTGVSIAPVNPIEHAKFVDVVVPAIGKAFDAPIPHPTDRETIKVMRTDAAIPTGRYFAKVKAENLPRE